MTQFSGQHGYAQHVAKAWLERYRMSSSKARVAVLTTVLAVVLVICPSGYIVEQPGPVLDVLGTVSEDSKQQIIQISGQPDQNSASDQNHSVQQGKLYMTTVNSYGVDGSVSNAFALLGYFLPNMGVIPTEAVIAPQQSRDEFDQQNQHEMTSAQDTAVQVAERVAQQQGIATDHVRISMHINDIGGPSAGMMYTLGILQKLSGTDLTGGNIIAGTGTISTDGTVGAIGGIRFKMIGAKSKGATWFIAPRANCADIKGHVPHGLTVVAVSTIEQAYSALQHIGSGSTHGLPSCAA